VGSAQRESYLLPNIILLPPRHVDHFNVQTEEYLGAVMLCRPWCSSCGHTTALAFPLPGSLLPGGLLAFSVVQYGNTIWGFQLAWYLVLLSLSAAISSPRPSRLTWSPSSVRCCRRGGQLLVRPGIAHLADRLVSCISGVAPCTGRCLDVGAIASTLRTSGLPLRNPRSPEFAIEHPVIALSSSCSPSAT